MSEDTTEVTTPTEEAKPSDATAEAPPEPRAFVVPKTKKGEIVVEILDANRNVVEVAVIEGPVPFRLDAGMASCTSGAPSIRSPDSISSPRCADGSLVDRPIAREWSLPAVWRLLSPDAGSCRLCGRTRRDAPRSARRRPRVGLEQGPGVAEVGPSRRALSVLGRHRVWDL
jgi:hypothetical protein